MLLFHKVKLTTEKLDFYETLVYNLLVRFIRLYGKFPRLCAATWRCLCAIKAHRLYGRPERRADMRLPV
jgi:CRISPR/Cas system endoribonuclease Cas6 (RAMP superfamily)